MSGIIEIWRRKDADGMPVRFTVGQPAVLPNGEMAGGPVVEAIEMRELGGVPVKRMPEPVFCIIFEESFVQRFIPVSEVIDIAYETKTAEVVQTPSLPTE